MDPEPLLGLLNTMSSDDTVARFNGRVVHFDLFNSPIELVCYSKKGSAVLRPVSLRLVSTQRIREDRVVNTLASATIVCSTRVPAESLIGLAVRLSSFDFELFGRVKRNRHATSMSDLTGTQIVSLCVTEIRKRRHCPYCRGAVDQHMQCLNKVCRRMHATPDQ